MRSLRLPVAIATLKGLVLDQLGAVKASFKSSSITSEETSSGRKSRVLRLEAKNSENSGNSGKVDDFM